MEVINYLLLSLLLVDELSPASGTGVMIFFSCIFRVSVLFLPLKDSIVVALFS